MFTGHALVKVFGRQREAMETFDEHNQRLYESSFRAQFISGLIQPAMMFIGNVNYVLVAVVGGLRVASGQLSLGDVQAFIQYSRQFSQPLTQVAQHGEPWCSPECVRRARLRPAGRARADARAARRSTWAGCAGRVAFEDVSFRYLPDKPLIDHLSLSVEPGQTVAHRRSHRRRQDHAGQPADAVLRRDRGRITLDGVDIATMPREELREQIGMVLQDTWLFGGTIAENIAYGADSFDMSRCGRRPRRRTSTVRADAAGRLRHGDRRGGARTSAPGRSS
jgi:ATP-binding cassette subfamily B protein